MPSSDTRDTLLAERIRSAACVALKNARPATLTIAELVRAIERMGIPIPPPANKTLSDALRWEVGRGRIVKWRRGEFRLGTLARATEYGMRQRIAAYLAGETVHPHSHKRTQPPYG